MDRRPKYGRLPEGVSYLSRDARMRKPLVPDKKTRKAIPFAGEIEPRVGRIPRHMYRWREAVERQRAIEAERLDRMQERMRERDLAEYEVLTGERQKPPKPKRAVPMTARPVNPRECPHSRSSWEANRGRGTGALYRCHACGTYIIGPKIRDWSRDRG